MSYWENPEECFNEMCRILKPGGQVRFFESHNDIDIEEALDQIRQNMADKSWLWRWGAVELNRFGLKRGGSVGLKLYTQKELQQLAAASSFGIHNSIEKTSLQNVPIFVCIHLWKQDFAE